MPRRRKKGNAGETPMRCGKTGKLAHPSKTEARRHLKALRRHHDYGGDVYLCPACGGYHVGWAVWRRPRPGKGVEP